MLKMNVSLVLTIWHFIPYHLPPPDFGLNPMHVYCHSVYNFGSDLPDLYCV